MVRILLSKLTFRLKEFFRGEQSQIETGLVGGDGGEGDGTTWYPLLGVRIGP